MSLLSYPSKLVLRVGDIMAENRKEKKKEEGKERAYTLSQFHHVVHRGGLVRHLPLWVSCC
jgi:hypothetical protein